MTEVLDSLRLIAVSPDPRDIVDILIVAAISYWLLSLIEGTTAVALLRGLAVVFIVGFLATNLLGLTVLNWLFRNAIPALLVAVPIIFQAELRRALAQIGRAGSLARSTGSSQERLLDVVSAAAGRLAERNWGAIIVLERELPVGEYAEGGVHLDAELSVEFLLSIFFPHSPLHDGAAIIRGDRLLAAACVLPLADTVQTGRQYGTRHRAALGITAKTDALSIVVSEESGEISICNNGRIVGNLDQNKARRMLALLYRSKVRDPIPQFLRILVPSRPR